MKLIDIIETYGGDINLFDANNESITHGYVNYIPACYYNLTVNNITHAKAGLRVFIDYYDNKKILDLISVRLLGIREHVDNTNDITEQKLVIASELALLIDDLGKACDNLKHGKDFDDGGVFI